MINNCIIKFWKWTIYQLSSTEVHHINIQSVQLFKYEISIQNIKLISNHWKMPINAAKNSERRYSQSHNISLKQQQGNEAKE